MVLCLCSFKVLSLRDGEEWGINERRMESLKIFEAPAEHLGVPYGILLWIFFINSIRKSF